MGERLLSVLCCVPSPRSCPGCRLESIEAVLAAAAGAAGAVLLIEGGQFVRPAVALGHVQHAVMPDGSLLALETVSISPLIFSVEGFLSHDDCDHIIEQVILPPILLRARIPLIAGPP